jgi:putative ABC transport system permease protein
MAGIRGVPPFVNARAAMFARLVFRALTVRNAQVLVALTSIAVGAAVVSALMCLYLDVSIKMSEELRTFGANFTVGQDPSQDQRGIAESTGAAIAASLPAGTLVGATPVLYGVARLGPGNAVVAGVNFAGLRRISPYWQVEGSWVGVDFDERNAMVGRRLAEAMELKPGRPMTIVNQDGTVQARVTVKGIVDTGDAEDEQVFINLSLAQKLFGMAGRVDLALFSIVARGSEADALADGINRRFAGVQAKAIRKISQSDGQILDKIDGLMALVASTILIITTLCVNATLTAMVARRTPEIGLQKALGAGNAMVMAQFLSETAVLCLTGVVIGLALGFGLAQILGQAVFGGWVTFRPAVVPLTMGISLAAALAAAVIPIRGAIRIVPARVLRGE